MVRIWLRVWLALALCVGVAHGDEIAVDMTSVTLDAEDATVLNELESCDALTDDADIRARLVAYQMELGWITWQYLQVCIMHAEAVERERYWSEQIRLSQSPEERAAASASHRNAFNIMIMLGGKKSRLYNRMQILGGLIQALERKLN